MQLDHQGRFTGSGGVSYDLLKNLRVHADFLYGSGLRAGFANLEELTALLPGERRRGIRLEYARRRHPPIEAAF